MQQRQSIGIVTRYIARPFSTKRALSKPLITPKQNEAIERNQDILSSYMVPGKLKKFFKTRPTRSQAILEENIPTSTAFPATRPRKVAEQKFAEPPSIAQQQLAQRIERAILKMNASEPLPSRFVTPEYIRVVGVKALSNLQKCHVYWRPCSGDGKSADKMKEALKLYQPVMTKLIRRHANMRRPVAIKYVQDRNGEELESIFKQLSQQEENPAQR